MEEAIKEGIQKASEVSVQSHEDTVMQLTPTDRGRFYSHEYRIQAVKEQISRLKTRKIEDDFYKWNKDEFIELSECHGIKAYIRGE